MIDKREIVKIKKMKIKARGQNIRNALSCVEVIEGKQGLLRLKEELKKLDCLAEEHDNLKNLKTFKWYPLWYEALLIIAAIDFFKWDREKIKSFGRCCQKVSFFEKALLRYFISAEKTLNLANERWQKHYSQGEIEIIEFNRKEKYAVIRIKNFSVHPNHCLFLSGYFESAATFVVPDKGLKIKIEAEETECAFQGKEHHQYSIKWQ